ncbi:MAG: ribosomal RNA small subunit methyltransferase A [Pelagibacteraceae bacterium]|nr:MAG: ribosomal RNA small subunit methyltransferase A [Pelagibacteraceae bacterium]
MFKHKKYLGQNFLINKDIIKKIADIGLINKDTNVIEIGPGSGILTEELLKRNPKKIFAIEFDRDLTNYLDKIKNNYNNFNFIISDALIFNERKIFKKKTVIFGNLPYNISLKLLIKWIYTDPWPPFYDQMILMFQKEVAERIIATSNQKKYGRISILTDARLNVKFHFNILKKEFNPEPKVDSSVLSFTPKKNTNFKLKDLNILSDVTKVVFNSKRKMVSKTLKKLLNEKELKIINFENIKNLRPENLDFSFYYKLVDLIKSRS